MTILFFFPIPTCHPLLFSSPPGSRFDVESTFLSQSAADMVLRFLSSRFPRNVIRNRDVRNLESLFFEHPKGIRKYENLESLFSGLYRYVTSPLLDLSNRWLKPCSVGYLGNYATRPSPNSCPVFTV